MSYFRGIQFGVADRIPDCGVWIDRAFPFFALNYAHSGQLDWRMNSGDRVVLQAPVLFWTWPGKRFVYGIPSGEIAAWDQSYVTYSGPLARRMSQLALRGNRPWCAVLDPLRVRQSFDDLLDTLHQPSPDVDWAVHLLQGLLLQTRRQMKTSDTASMDSKMSHLRIDIADQPGKAWSADSEAERLGMSPVHFRRLFASHGVSFHQFVILARMQQAAALLRRTQLPVKQIAVQCGYYDLSHFHKAFTTQHGRPPAAYRQHAHSLAGPTN